MYVTDNPSSSCLPACKKVLLPRRAEGHPRCRGDAQAPPLFHCSGRPAAAETPRASPRWPAGDCGRSARSDTAAHTHTHTRLYVMRETQFIRGASEMQKYPTSISLDISVRCFVRIILFIIIKRSIFTFSCPNLSEYSLRSL